MKITTGNSPAAAAFMPPSLTASTAPALRPLVRMEAAYAFFLRAASSLQSPILLIIRLYWGWSFFQSGKGKLLNHEQVTDFFTTLALPAPGLNTWLAGGTECFGGLLLLCGLASRLTAVPLIFTMIVAYLTSELEVVKNLVSEPDKFTGADPFLFLFASIIVLVFGPGTFSLDHLISRRLQGSSTAPAAQANA
jgi:putative oxidoreductase